MTSNERGSPADAAPGAVMPSPSRRSRRVDDETLGGFLPRPGADVESDCPPSPRRCRRSRPRAPVRGETPSVSCEIAAERESLRRPAVDPAIPSTISGASARPGVAARPPHHHGTVRSRRRRGSGSTGSPSIRSAQRETSRVSWKKTPCGNLGRCLVRRGDAERRALDDRDRTGSGRVREGSVFHPGCGRRPPPRTSSTP